jgi:hypothetical protein
MPNLGVVDLATKFSVGGPSERHDFYLTKVDADIALYEDFPIERGVTVKNAFGFPLSGASVSIDNGPGKTTNVEGIAFFPSLYCGPHEIAVTVGNETISAVHTLTLADDPFFFL